MKWNEVSVHTNNEAIEAVSNILMDMGSEGVAIENKQDFINKINDGFGEIKTINQQNYVNEGVLVKAYYPETVNLTEFKPEIKKRVNELKNFGLAVDPNIITVSAVKEEDWATAWKKYYFPQRITSLMTVVPKWEEYKPVSSNEIIIRLDPGLAFGTGTHPTTRLSLQALEIYSKVGETVLDVGTGSGVLSIAAKALGAKEVFAYDLDDVAVQSAKDNVLLNPFAKDVHVSSNDLLKGIKVAADLIVANILAEIILLLIPEAWRLLKPEGKFITSGIIESKKEVVYEALIEQGFEVIQVLQMKDWFTIVAQKPKEDN